MFELPDDPEIQANYPDEWPIRQKYWQPRQGEVAIDVGALYGSYTMPALEAGATVVAVEPNVSAAATLVDIAVTNGLDERLRVRNCALFDGTPYPAELRAALESVHWSWMCPSPDAEYTTLDRLVFDMGLRRLDWIKIDVEGAELGVLHGARSSLAFWHPKLLIEDHTLIYPYVAEMDSARKIREFLSGFGYNVVEDSYEPPLRTYLIAR